MPYINIEDRKKYNEFLCKLSFELSNQKEEDLGGHLNYCISVLLKSLFDSKRRYVRANTIRGSVENALTEWYRCSVSDYEDQKKQENGDI